MAPRPAAARTRKPPWYKTTAGQTIAAVSLMVAAIFILVLVNNARSEAQQQEQAQQSLESYSDQVRGLLQQVTAPASEMTAVATAAPDDLAADAGRWSEAFTSAQAGATAFSAPAAAAASQDLFLQSIQLYQGAADTFGVAAGLEGKQQTELIGAATAQAASAASVWDAAVAVLDDARDEVDLGPSGIRSPAAAPPTGVETPGSPTATIPIEPEDADGGGAGGGNAGSGGGNDGGAGGGGGKNKKGDGKDG